MIKRYSSFLILSLLLLILPPVLRAQDAPVGTTRTARFLSHFDLGVSGIALLTKDVSGTVNDPTVGSYDVTQSASSSAGALVTLRGEKSPWKGLEFNYSYARVTEGYTCCNYTTGPFQAQVNASEYTFGYLVRPQRQIFGFQPYASVGAGTFAFTPTKNGGQGLQKQARAAYYYSAGVEGMLVGNTLGARAGIRQLFYLAPDFDQNYLRILKHTFTTEPQAGLFLRF